MREIVIYIMMIIIILLFLMICLQHHYTKEEFAIISDDRDEMLETIEGLETKMMAMTTYVTSMDESNIKAFDAFEKVINYHQTNMLMKSDLAFKVEELVNQYLEVHDER